MTSERRRTALVLLVGAGVVAVDQLTKTIAVQQLDFGDPIHLLWTLQLNLVYNRGGAFSIGSGLTPYITAAATVVLAVLLVSARRAMSGWSATGLGLVIGGAAGNLVDRLLRANDGAVIDFLDLQWWPVFNVADIALSLGAVVLVGAALFESPDNADPEPGPHPAGASGAAEVPDGELSSRGGDDRWTS